MRGSAIKGLDSYRIEDGVSFYGRDADSERLVSRLLSSRFLLLHARSGAGKTSLLQARAAPDLEAEGWNVVISRPGQLPTGSTPSSVVQADVIKAVLPPPATELQSIARACEKLLPGRPLKELAIHDVLASYRQLEKTGRSPNKPRADAAGAQDVLRFLQGPVRPDVANDSEEYYPQFNALLRGGLTATSYLRHACALCAEPPFDGPEENARRTPLPAIVEMLEDARSGTSAALLDVLNAHAGSLTDFFSKFFAIYGKWRPTLKLALVLDQFEELFTLFGDSDSAVLPDVTTGGMKDLHPYSLRDEFFAQLQTLYGRIGAPELGAERRQPLPPLPLCCVISTRQEYIADLDPVRAFVRDLDQWSFHLDRLECNVAQAVLVDMTMHSAWPFPKELAGRIAEGLTREGRYIDPAELQVVTSRILDESPAAEGAEAAYASPEEAFEGLGRDTAGQADAQRPNDRDLARNILSRFFFEFLDEASSSSKAPGGSKRARLELLEILQLLITERGKAPAPVQLLIDAPFRSRKRRQELLSILEKQHIVRTEFKGGIPMTEIRHDFLIRPIQRLVREELKTEEYGRLIAAQAVLISRIESLSDDLGKNLLTMQQFEDVVQHRETLSWDYSLDRWRWTPAELMLRSALSFREIEPEALKLWAELASGSYRSADHHAARSTLCTRESIEALNREPDRASFNPHDLASIVRGHLELCRDAERGWIEYWTKRWIAPSSGSQHV